MRKFNFNFGSFVVAALLSLGSVGSAQASGFALIEMNANGQGNAYAGAAAYTPNASTVYFNPAGMMKLEGEQISFVSHYIDPTSDFENKGSKLADGITDISGGEDDGGESAFVPNFYWVRPIDDNMTFGFGVNSPFGLATEYEDDWVGRYHAILSDLKTVNFNPSIGYRVNDKVSIGGGINIMLADVELTSAVDFGSLGGFPQAADGMAELEADSFDELALGFNFGVMFMVSDRTNVGVSYRSKIDLEVDGDADFTVPAAVAPLLPPGNFVDTGLSAEVTLPANLSVSVAHTVDKFTWLADVTWTGWSVFDELRIEYDSAQLDTVTTEDWDDSFRYSAGFDYQYSDSLVLRAGLALDETPIPSDERRTPRIPGDERFWVSVGLSYMAGNTFSFDVGYSRLTVDDPEINNTFESPVSALNHTLTGEYDADVDILSAQLNWKLD